MVELSHRPQWCPGCGDFGILLAVKNALEETGKEPWETVIVSGIGCSGKFPHYIKTYGFEGIHGRALPVATGIRLANPSLNVIAVFGDGDGYGIGGNHFVHACRRNPDIVAIGFNNEVYALTTGQTSPTSPEGVGKTWNASMEKPVNPLLIALSAGAGFVARGFAGNLKHLSWLIAEGIRYRGFAFIDVIQPCVTWRNTFREYRERVRDIGINRDIGKAYKLAEDRMNIGIVYMKEGESMEERMKIGERLSSMPDFDYIAGKVVRNFNHR